MVLAAGRGSRFGGGKLLTPWRGRPLLAHTLAAVRAAVTGGSLQGGVVVIPGGSLTLAELVRAAGLTPVVNADAAAGLGDSLRLGVLHLERTLPYGGPTAAVIFLGDQPLVRPDVVAALVAAWRSGTAAVVRPRYSEAPGEPGHPLVVDRTLWHLAARLTGESGLGPALAERGIAPLVLDVAGDNPDVDTRRDLTNLEDRTR